MSQNPKDARRNLSSGASSSSSLPSFTISAAVPSTSNHITITALDSQAIMEHSQEIADALTASLHSHNALRSHIDPVAGSGEDLGAVASHKTATSTDDWDAAANEKRLPSPMPVATAKAMYAWIDTSKVKDGEIAKSACKFPHHEVSADGKPGAANIKACQSAIGAVNGARTKPDIPDADRKGVYNHLAKHLKDAGLTPPDFKEKLEASDMRTLNETFVMSQGDTSFAPTTLDDKNRTVDVVWYTGATVPRTDPQTYQPYMLRLDMNGCRMDRLNAGAPFFDNHMTGTDYASHSAGLAGSRAQLATVQKAWSEGPVGKATLKFDAKKDDDDEDDPSDDMFEGIKSGKFRNLSFGTWIYDKKLESSTTDAAGNKMDSYVATDWEPYEISQANVPADFNTEFLTAAPGEALTFIQFGDRSILSIPQNIPADVVKSFLAAHTAGEKRAITAPNTKEPPVMETTTQAPGEQARTEAQLSAQIKAAEKERRTAIRVMLAPFGTVLDAKFIDSMVDGDFSVEEVRKQAMDKIAASADQFITRTEHASVTRDGKETRFECMAESLIRRSDPQSWQNSLKTLPPAEQQRRQEMAREYVSVGLFEMARESVQLNGMKTRGMNKNDIAAYALNPSQGPRVERFGMGGAESTSDFPAILANVANKTLRQAYEAMPQTFKPFSKPATAADFKPINRVELNDLPSLPLLNEKGEYKRVNLTDQNATYSLATYGGVVAITRKAIINDDLSAFTRTSATLGVAAARTQSDIVWALITNNGNYSDGNAIFSTAHSNKNTGASTSIDPTVNTGSNATLQAILTGRKGLRLQKAPNGTPLNLVPRFLLSPAALESYALQVIYPAQLAASTVAGVVPEWATTLTPIIEPRLDAVSSTAWYLVADPATIDTVEYCFLEGQEGVYYEMRQGFDVDGLEIKARLDFGAQIIDFRGMQLNAGA